MPLYLYQVIEADGSEGEIFEIMQGMNDQPLSVHPENGKPIKRIIGLPNGVTRFTSSQLSNKNLDKLGFTKYEKAGGGYYEKTAGSGPNVIKR